MMAEFNTIFEWEVSQLASVMKQINEVGVTGSNSGSPLLEVQRSHRKKSNWNSAAYLTGEPDFLKESTPNQMNSLDLINDLMGPEAFLDSIEHIMLKE
jgi:hypothetical protein